MGGFNPAWFISVAGAVVLAVITASTLSEGWVLGLRIIAAVFFIVGVGGLTVNFSRAYKLRLPFAPRQQTLPERDFPELNVLPLEQIPVVIPLEEKREQAERKDEQWAPLQAPAVLGAIKHLKRAPMKPPVKILATAQGRAVAETLVQIFCVSGWTVQHDLATARCVFPLNAEEGVYVVVRYRESVTELGIPGSMAVEVVLRGLFPGRGRLVPFPESDVYNFIQIEVGVRLN